MLWWKLFIEWKLWKSTLENKMFSYQWSLNDLAVSTKIVLINHVVLKWYECFSKE